MNYNESQWISKIMKNDFSKIKNIKIYLQIINISNSKNGNNDNKRMWYLH